MSSRTCRPTRGAQPFSGILPLPGFIKASSHPASANNTPLGWFYPKNLCRAQLRHASRNGSLLFQGSCTNGQLSRLRRHYPNSLTCDTAKRGASPQPSSNKRRLGSESSRNSSLHSGNLAISSPSIVSKLTWDGRGHMPRFSTLAHAVG
ncbi:uncharacterized protein EKO05_0010245 [Ascochyta rabiei]|uniref:uncharacterized protein n=1 Tax=Didymella rabiei TaxID=5454 RepID=UPI00220C5086|nr:uncharacterized protein EKO05_0010245 [Ascochyta rabiei]UPX19998.1 hypothetical protein EKO05_0010245 [Ascochyta rabiei]